MGCKRMLVVGLACVDHTSTFPEYPEPDTKNVALTSTLGGGGNAANAACGLAHMGDTAQLVTALHPEDPHGAFIERELRDRGVDVSCSVRLPGTAALSYIVVDDRRKTRTIFHSRAAPPTIPSARIPEVVSACDGPIDVLLLDGRHWEAAHAVATACLKHRPSLEVLLDCERHDREGLQALLQVASIPLCTQEFVQRLHPAPDLPAALALFLDAAVSSSRRTRAAIVTRGSSGCILAVRQPAVGPQYVDAPGWHVTTFPAVPPDEGQSIVDTTGGGDAFQAGLAHCLARGIPLPAAVRTAAYVATFNCCGVGTRHYPLGSQVAAFIERHASIQE